MARLKGKLFLCRNVPKRLKSKTPRGIYEKITSENLTILRCLLRFNGINTDKKIYNVPVEEVTSIVESVFNDAITLAEKKKAWYAGN